MVHALEIIRKLLKEDGRLVDIHPLEDERPVEVRIADQTYLAGWLREEDDFVSYIQAGEAIAQAVQQGWYALERKDSFTYMYHSDSITALQKHLDENWQQAILDDIVVMRAQDLMQSAAPDKEVILREPVWIGRLRPLRDEASQSGSEEKLNSAPHQSANED